jgi:hypothetical protein
MSSILWYSVFGRVVKGMEVVEQIAKVDVDSKDKPIRDVVIVNCGELIKKSALAAIPVTSKLYGSSGNGFFG